MKVFTHSIWVILSFLMAFLASCNSPQPNTAEEISDVVNKEGELTGNYVTESYFQKDEGYDWVGLIIKKGDGSNMKISVRSRADEKNPTCTYEGIIYKMDNNTFTNIIDGSEITYKFSSDSLIIKAIDQEGSNAIMYYCSGGATFEGSYVKIDGPLDPDQVDQTIFKDFLMLQDRGYIVQTTPDEDKQRLEIIVMGVSGIDQPHKEIISNNIRHAEIEDLDSDGSPELIIFFEDYKGDKERFPLVYTIHEGPLLNKISFPELKESSKGLKGYMGQDEFALIETSIVRRFQLFELQMNDTIKTDMTRQIIYKLNDNGSLVVADIQEY